MQGFQDSDFSDFSDMDIQGNQNNNWNNQSNMNYNQSNMNHNGMNQNGMNQNGMNQNNMNQNYGSVSVQSNFNLNRDGIAGFNLLLYAFLGTLLFMTGSTTSLMILLLAVILVEKDNELTRVIVTIIATAYTIYVGYNILKLIIEPVGEVGSAIMDKASYESFIYNIGKLINNSISSLLRLLSWCYDLLLIVVGASSFKKIKNGTLQIPKIIQKYI